jgi:hypothetical protein
MYNVQSGCSATENAVKIVPHSEFGLDADLGAEEQTHVCLSSNQGVGTVVMKNWLPLVLGPAFAMLKVYGLQAVG